MNKQTSKLSPEEHLARINYTQVVQGVQFRIKAKNVHCFEDVNLQPLSL